MNMFDRMQQLHRLFSRHRRPVPYSKIAENLECSERTARRLVVQLRDTHLAPLEYDKQAKGWYYNSDEKFELPGIWLTGDELHSLSMLLDILGQFGSKSLSSELQPVKQTIYKLLESRGIDPATFATHIKVLPIGNRQLVGNIFNRVSEALLHKKRLAIQYKSYKHQLTERSLSPQDLIYYRDNWYLDAWCHLRKDLRTFSISRIVSAEILKNQSLTIEQEQLQKHFASSYGIFSGKGKHKATLRFSSEVAREVSMQQWHPDQLAHL